MIIRMPGGTGGAVSPWAIFVHDQSGQWSMAYARGKETVWRLRIVNRRIRALMPAPYEGACTRFTREREVRYSGGHFRSRLLKRKQVLPASQLLTAERASMAAPLISNARPAARSVRAWANPS